MIRHLHAREVLEHLRDGPALRREAPLAQPGGDGGDRAIEIGPAGVDVVEDLLDSWLHRGTDPRRE